MLPPMVIFKDTTPRWITNVLGSQGTVVGYQKKSWMYEKLMLIWISDIWVKYTKKRPSLLFLDTFSAHLTDKVKYAFHIFNTTIVLVIPGGCTSILQPLDVSINKPCKTSIRNSWVQYILKHSNDEVIRKPPKQLVVNSIEEANTKLNSNLCIVKKSFLVTGLSNAHGKEEDHLIRNDEVRKEINAIIAEVLGEVNMGFHEPEPTNDDSFESKGNDESDSGSEGEMNVKIIPGIMFTFVSPSEPESNIYKGHNGYVLILLEMEC